ncbi:MAG: DUF2092 domain-containing protein [Planctomycetia bacterium]|nr:DUF2092 domain-containing protein [Planctomycetia bacterium]
MAVEATARQHYGVMRKYLDSLPAYSLELDRSYEEVLDDAGRKIFLAEIGHILLARPNRVRSQFDSDRGGSLLCFDGRTVNIVHYLRKAWAEFELNGNLKQLAEFMAERFSIALPLADLLAADTHLLNLDEAERGDYVGVHLVENVRCHHLAIEQPKVNWQIWIDAGERPWPRKLVIDFKTDLGRPISLTVFRNWIANPPIDDDSFKFVPPEGIPKTMIS